LESDAWITADGVVVLDHDGVVPGLRRRRIADVNRDQLPGHIPALAELFESCGTDFDLALDLRDPGSGPAVADEAERAGHDPRRLWLVAADDWEAAAEWKSARAEIRVADSSRRRSWKEGAERRAANLADRRVDAVNLHHTDWSAGLVTLFHRFEILCFAWDCQHDRVLASMATMGLDGVFSDHVDRLAASFRGR
jgi:glycerophosphoryl diester phosphodiesterase